jgi:hypothetical protein
MVCATVLRIVMHMLHFLLFCECHYIECHFAFGRSESFKEFYSGNSRLFLLIVQQARLFVK